jgi:hypothetical protein
MVSLLNECENGNLEKRMNVLGRRRNMPCAATDFIGKHCTVYYGLVRFMLYFYKKQKRYINSRKLQK